MTEPRPHQVAVRLRDTAARARALGGDLQRRSWPDGRDDDETIANLARAAVRLDDAAEALDGEALPARDFVINSAVTTVLFAGGTAVVLATVPDPGRPWVVASAVVAGWLVADVYGRAYCAARARRLAVEPDPPPDIQVTARLASIRADVRELLSTVEQRPAAAEHVRAAQIWL